MLTGSQVEEFYPDLASRSVGKYGTADSWRRDRLKTASGFTIDAMGLDTASRGLKDEWQRPDAIFLDDIDAEDDSPAETERKIKVITKSLLPARSKDAIIVFCQNLIHRNSIAAQLADGRAQFMAGRIVSGPIPALLNFDNDSYHKNADGTFTIDKGDPTWPGYFDLKACEAELNAIGPAAFMSECQHITDRPLPGALFREFNETYHVITDSEFIEGYRKLGVTVNRGIDGRAVMPERFNVGRAEDVGTTQAHPNVTSWVARPSQVHPLNECVFAHRELVFPETWASALEEPAPVSLRRVSEEIHRLEAAALERFYVDVSELDDIRRRGLDANIEWTMIDRQRVPIYSRVKRSLISHEASSEVNTYMMDLPDRLKLAWEKWDAYGTRMQGIAQIQNYLEIRANINHPFRNYPDGHEKAGQPLPGCPRFFFVVADGQGELYYADGRLQTRAATNAQGMQRARWEFPQYRLPENASGVEQDKPVKINDDYVDALKALALDFFPPSGPLTVEERVQKELPVTLQTKAILAQNLSEQDQAMAWLAQQSFINQHQLGQKKQGRRGRLGKYIR